ncbi:MAG: membrane protein insertase YidC [Spirochaetia bacterium]
MINKRILAAGVLSIAVIVGFVMLQNRVISPKAAPPEAPGEVAQDEQQPVEQFDDPAETRVPALAELPELDIAPAGALPGGEQTARTVRLETGVYTAEFSTRGGTVSSLRLKSFTTPEGQPVEMILNGSSEILPFTLTFGNVHNEPLDEIFRSSVDEERGEVRFSRDFVVDGRTFTLEKTYTFPPDEYAMRLAVTMTAADGEDLPVNRNGISYTVSFGPQIGPTYTKLDDRSDYRYYSFFDGEEKKSMRTSTEKITHIEEEMEWTSVEGKYFTVIGVPTESHFIVTDSTPAAGVDRHSSFHFTFPEIDASRHSSETYFYIGPKKKEQLFRYNRADSNYFGLENMQFDTMASNVKILGVLSEILGGIITGIRYVTRNYGLAVILFAVIVRLALIPLSWRNFRDNRKMRELEPKIAEIRRRYQYNGAQANQEITELYQREKISSLRRLLPLFIQIPIIIALFRLFSTDFDFRDAAFLPVWIERLSSPDSIVEFPFTVPVVKWDALRILPFIMLATTLVQTRITQPPAEGSTGQKIMSYATPILIFLILYNMPSGLVLYWLVYNGLGIAEHYVFRRRYEES